MKNTCFSVIFGLALALASSDSPRDPVLDEARWARQELELAREGHFYYELDVENRTLTLKLHGVALRHFALESVEVGRSWLAPSARGWRERVHTLEPPPARERREIDPSEEGRAVAASISEAENPLPTAFVMRAGPSLSLWIVSQGSQGRMFRWLVSRLPRLGETWSSVRLHLRVSPEDLRLLYLSRPEKASLLLKIPAEGSAPREKTEVDGKRGSVERHVAS